MVRKAHRLLTPDMGWDYNPGAASDRLQRLYDEKVKAAPQALQQAIKKND